MARKTELKYREISERELDIQQEYIEKIRLILSVRYAPFPKAYVHTYGCQQNVSDSERIKGLLARMGYIFTENITEADFILFNTCAVREHAQDRVFGNVGRLKHHKLERPNAVIALCGCMMQQEHIADKIKKSFLHVDLVFGTHVIHRLPELLYKQMTGGERVFERPDEQNGTISEGLPVYRNQGVRGFLPIMYGCNNFCTYCIVPYVRGRERSRKPEEIEKEFIQMVKAGYKDITLLGQNVNSYGNNEPHGVDFTGLLRRLNALDGDFRIRFMTSHPKDCTPALVTAMRECEKVSKHLHLPFQAGSDRILKAMNRGYTAESYLALIALIQKEIPGISLTSDVIVGFPGEEYDDFKKTLEIVESVGFSSLYTFLFSPRKGTPAELMNDPVPKQEKNKWFAELLKLQERMSAQYTGAMVGNVYRVLCEGKAKSGRLTGRTDTNILMEFEGDDRLIGNFVQVHAWASKGWTLDGKAV